MKVRDIMTKATIFVTPDANLNDVAKMMDEHKIGMIPVVDNKDSRTVTGVVTDRDIVTRCVARQMNPMAMHASEVMSRPVVTVREDDSVDDAASVMSENMIRRVMVVDAANHICGVLAQADIALKASDKVTGGMLHEVSQPTKEASSVTKGRG